jgi:hypothetical protein
LEFAPSENGYPAKIRCNGEAVEKANLQRLMEKAQVQGFRNPEE